MLSKLIAKFFIFLFFTLLFIECKKEKDKSFEIFEKEINLKADSVNMSITLKAGNIYFSDPYIIVKNMSSTLGYHFAVYNRDLQFLYTFCNYGEGPDEVLMPSVVKNLPPYEFILRDNSTNKFYNYLLNDSNSLMIETYESGSFNPNEFFWEINYIDKDKFLVKSVGTKEAKRQLINLKDQSVIFSLDQTFNLKSKMGKDYYTEFDDCWIVSNKDEFACAYFFIDRIDFGKIKNNQLTIEKYYGVKNPPDFFKYTNEKLDGKYEYNVDYNIVYFEWMFGTKDKIFTSYFGKPWGEIDRHSNIIFEFDYSGKGLTKYNLDIPLASFIIIEDKIIGINPERSDDFFYIYNL